MLRKPTPQQTALEMVSLDGLVPKDHLLRKIEAVIDFSFIHDRVAGLYCPDNGRPPLDPTLMFKALFIGYLFGIRSERQLVREIEAGVPLDSAAMMREKRLSPAMPIVWADRP
jgi:transposase